MSLADVVINYPEFIGFQLVGERTIVQDDPDNEVRALCFTCIAVMNKRAKLIPNTTKKLKHTSKPVTKKSAADAANPTKGTKVIINKSSAKKGGK